MPPTAPAHHRGPTATPSSPAPQGGRGSPGTQASQGPAFSSVKWVCDPCWLCRPRPHVCEPTWFDSRCLLIHRPGLPRPSRHLPGPTQPPALWTDPEPTCDTWKCTSTHLSVPVTRSLTGSLRLALAVCPCPGLAYRNTAFWLTGSSGAPFTDTRGQADGHTGGSRGKGGAASDPGGAVRPHRADTVSRQPLKWAQ